MSKSEKDKVLNEFKKRWLENVEEIKKHKFDSNQIFHIKYCFIRELPYLLSLEKETDPIQLKFEITKLSNDIDLALEIAFSNYRSERYKNKSFWGISLFGNTIKKLPQPKIDI